MKKFAIFIITALILVAIIVLAFLLIGRYKQSVSNNDINLQGQIIINNLNKATLIYPQNTSINYYEEIEGEPFFSDKSDRIFLLGYSELFEYNLNVGKKHSVFKLDGESPQYNGKWEKPQFNSFTNVISCVNRYDRGIYLFNFEKKLFAKIPNVKVGINATMHSITKDGKNLIFTKEDFQIVSLNLLTGEQKILGDGIDPVLSKDDSLMAYHITQQSNTLYIKNLENNKIWEIKIPSNYIRHYEFSPNGNYLAVMYGEGKLDKIRLSIFDYHTGELVKTLVDNFTTNYSNSFDWK